MSWPYVARLHLKYIRIGSWKMLKPYVARLHLVSWPYVARLQLRFGNFSYRRLTNAQTICRAFTLDAQTIRCAFTFAISGAKTMLKGGPNRPPKHPENGEGRGSSFLATEVPEKLKKKNHFVTKTVTSVSPKWWPPGLQNRGPRYAQTNNKYN